MYAGEPVTQTEHALQTAWQAQQNGAKRASDYRGPACTTWATCCTIWAKTAPTRESTIGMKRSGPSGWPAILVPTSSNRFVCMSRPSAIAARSTRRITPRLSDASRLSLKLQGGPFTETQARHFEQHPYFQDAVRLRLWDEAAKIPNLETPPLQQFLEGVRTAIS